MSAAKASVAMPEDTIKAAAAPIVWRTTDRLEASAFEEATLTRSLPRTRAASSHPPSPFVAFHHLLLLLLLLLVVVVVVKYEDDDDAIQDHLKLFSLSLFSPKNARRLEKHLRAFRPTRRKGALLLFFVDALEDDEETT